MSWVWITSAIIWPLSTLVWALVAWQYRRLWKGECARVRAMRAMRGDEIRLASVSGGNIMHLGPNVRYRLSLPHNLVIELSSTGVCDVEVFP